MLLRKFKTFRLRIGAKRALRDARAGSVRALAAHGGPAARVLVVCHGNIYRSPLVAVRLRELLGPGRVITSAGFHPKGDRPSPAEHIEMSARLGVDLSQHRSRVVSDEDFAAADLIVLMDQRNWVSLQRAGADESKYVWLGAMGPNPMEIPDPYGLDAALAEAIVKRLLLCTEELAKRLAALATTPRSLLHLPASHFLSSNHPGLRSSLCQISSRWSLRQNCRKSHRRRIREGNLAAGSGRGDCRQPHDEYVQIAQQPAAAHTEAMCDRRRASCLAITASRSGEVDAGVDGELQRAPEARVDLHELATGAGSRALELHHGYAMPAAARRAGAVPWSAVGVDRRAFAQHADAAGRRLFAQPSMREERYRCAVRVAGEETHARAGCAPGAAREYFLAADASELSRNSSSFGISRHRWKASPRR